ncbi:type I-E CRISPR-associated protein Cas5/CasD [Methylocystis sp. H62]|jgi:CRISPR system Cascade subunit CasD|uniref:type I-E CRISPR-associated protein Cas5/CasD n=1 Tax=Methylocystis sp. H62 TaxID=2785789 RepID=UPI0018C253DB|nr:type I-E CRISPR-associated protein Cas5/CasD [Methylocystis sp. H62]MBG0792835.1 type I-E CRISPR-associated protein Cas5/CasD [Methylocystis sp. H62]
MPRFLILRLEAPLVAFGDVMVDAFGPISDLPSASLLTGLIANALGYQRKERTLHQRLQDRLVYAARLDRRAGRFTEFQTVQLEKSDKGWTTRGKPDERAGGEGTYSAPHIRYRDHDADASALVAIYLTPLDETPDIDAIAAALREPFRPLFIGRKPCLPSAPIFDRFVEADTLLDALKTVPLAPERRGRETDVLVELPASDHRPERFRAIHRCDSRDWVAGVHAGDTVRWSGSLPRTAFTGG